MFTQAPAWVRLPAPTDSSAMRYAVVSAGAMNSPASAASAASTYTPGDSPAPTTATPSPAASSGSLTRFDARQETAP